MTSTPRAWTRSRIATLTTAALLTTAAVGLTVTTTSSASAIAAPSAASSTAANALPSGLPLGGLSSEALAMVRKYPQALAAARFYRAIETGNIADEDRSLAPGWVDVPLADGQGPGRAGFASVLQTYHQAFPNLRVHIDEIAVAGDTVTSRNTLTGNQDGPFLGVAATGSRVSFRTTDVHHIEHRLIQNSYHLEDLFGAYQQVTAKN